MAIIYVAFGIALPIVILLGNRNNANGQVGGIKLTAAEKRGREIFGENCSLCHTLAAANAVGKVGPNLDVIQPTEQLVLHTIAERMPAESTVRQPGGMPRRRNDACRRRARGRRHGGGAVR